MKDRRQQHDHQQNRDEDRDDSYTAGQAYTSEVAKTVSSVLMPYQTHLRRAFSLSEVLLAIWLFTFIGGALIAGFAYLAKANSFSSDRAAAELLADEIYESARYVGPPGWGFESLAGTRTLTAANGARSSYDWSFQPALIEQSGMGRYYQLKVTVHWREYKDGVEQGRKELVRVRYLYLDDLG